MKEIITLILRARHFKDTYYIDIENGCAIEKCTRESFPSAYEYVDGIEVAGKKYKHEFYGEYTFSEDKRIAESFGWNDTIIREIECTPSY